jgi:N-acetylglucosamine malate deacetylase 2
MEKVVCIFAHPDDEAFGPGGTIAKLALTHEVSIICATKGEAGNNDHPDKTSTLQSLREQELQESAKVLGVKHVYFLGFEDGTLCNNLYHKIAGKIKDILEDIKPQTLLTYEHRGVSGHIDHITMSMVTAYVGHRLPFVKKIMYYALERSRSSGREDYFIYFPPGYHPSEIHETVDISSVMEKKITAMKKHRSQQKDLDRILPRLEKFPAEEHFLIFEKDER